MTYSLKHSICHYQYYMDQYNTIIVQNKYLYFKINKFKPKQNWNFDVGERFILPARFNHSQILFILTSNIISI